MLSTLCVPFCSDDMMLTLRHVALQELDSSKLWKEVLGIQDLHFDVDTMVKAAAAVVETTVLSLVADKELKGEAKKQKLQRQIARMSEMSDKLGKPVEMEVPPRLMSEAMTIVMS